MTAPDLHPIAGRFWRMIRVPWQRDPLSGEGARLYGGRWNAKGAPALYLGASHDVAIAEYHRGLPKPGTLVPYDIRSDAIADLTDGAGRPRDAEVADAVRCDWTARMRAGDIPPSWLLVERMMAEGAAGALVPSVQHRGGVCLVLWSWHDAAGTGERAAVTVLDPMGDLIPLGAGAGPR
ncbi:RES family NAD+ phosphorylase [Sphingomonas sp. PR090111-T3T-6A]|uniref:RES family NAD+ phosphorylase n=1 Tax=Sphingomonas sp. PR090111-T3T-6A TaxID=685778 RepID=UPI00037B8C8A|nr:RES family NAD+ phosphorylase [Sphingomonas sp. PR090111-T3T-6A]